MSIDSTLKSAAAWTAEYLPKAIEVAEDVAAVMPMGAPVVSAIKLATTVAAGVINAEPALVAVYDEIQAARNGDAAPTQEQWDAWNAAADKAHSDLQAAIAAAEAAP